MQEKLQVISKMKKQMGKEDMSPEQQIISAIHAINIFHKLEPLNEKGQHCEIPQNWNQKENGQYKLIYTGLQQGGKLIFRFRGAEQKLLLCFGYEGQKEVTKVAFNKNEAIEEIVKKYYFNLNQFLTITQPNLALKPFYHSGNVEPINIQKQSSDLPSTKPPHYYPNIQKFKIPKNIINQSQEIPFGHSEYVGPNSQIFHNPYFAETKIPISQKIPVGARYDPVDPFDTTFQDNRDIPDGFTGFDQFGAPIDPAKVKKTPKYHPLQEQGGSHKGGLGGGGMGPLI